MKLTSSAFAQMYNPSEPVTFANCRTWVAISPSLFWENSSSQLPKAWYEKIRNQYSEYLGRGLTSKLYILHSWIIALGTSQGAAIAKLFATWRPATHLAQLPSIVSELIIDMTDAMAWAAKAWELGVERLVVGAIGPEGVPVTLEGAKMTGSTRLTYHFVFRVDGKIGNKTHIRNACWIGQVQRKDNSIYGISNHGLRLNRSLWWPKSIKELLERLGREEGLRSKRGRSFQIWRECLCRSSGSECKNMFEL